MFLLPCSSFCRSFPIRSLLFSSTVLDPDALTFLPGENDEHEHDSLAHRIHRLRKNESVGSAFQRWMGDGNPVHRGHIFHAINRFRKYKLDRRAFEMMEWVVRERPYKLKEIDYSFLLEFTIKLHGVRRGETLFMCIPPEFQNELLYNNLVMACLDCKLVRLSLSYMVKMRELSHPISYLVFNRLLLRSSPSLSSKILAQMKADSVPPHVSTFNILMKIEASRHRIRSLIGILSDMKNAGVEANEVSYCILATAHAMARLHTTASAYTYDIERTAKGDNWSTFDVLVMLYGHLRRPVELSRTWGCLKNLPKVPVKSYIVAVEAFGRVGDVGRAEETFAEMRARSTAEFNSILSVYCRRGMTRSMFEAYKEMRRAGCRANAITYRNMALGCLVGGASGRVLRLGEGMRVSRRVMNSGPWLETTVSMVEILAERGDVERAERLFEELERVGFSKHTFVFNILIKAYVKAEVWKEDLLRRMILGGAMPDSETYSLIGMLEGFRKS